MILALANTRTGVVLLPTNFPGSSPTTPSTNCDPALGRLRGELLAKVTTGVFNAQAAVAAGPTVVKANAKAFMQLAENSRELGKIEGMLDACSPPTLSVPQIRAALANNTRDLILLETRLNAAWLDQQYVSWMALRTSVQKFHRTVMKYKVWLATAASAQPEQNLPITDPVSFDPPTTFDPDSVTMPPGMEEVVPPAQPVYKRGWFWGAIAAVGAVAAGAALMTR